MIDYRIFYKDELSLDEREWDGNYDLFISAYNLSDRVNCVFDKMTAKRKVWLIFPDYCVDKNELPTGEVYCYEDPEEKVSSEDKVVNYILDNYIRISEYDSNSRICIDITGFIKPYMMYLIAKLKFLNFKKLDIIFSEPNYYEKKQHTQFSDANPVLIRQVAGFEGFHSSDVSSDVLVIGVGYDDALIREVADYKDKTNKIQIFGFPSLRADMYQENILRASLASDAIGRTCRTGINDYLSAANDPFCTAQLLQKICNQEINRNSKCNIYLSPLATKVQALGFVLYYLNECSDKQISIVYPFCRTHSKKTSEGIARVWKYTIEFL